MKVYRTDEIRNVVLLGHGGSGKTSLVEAMAYVSGATSRMGKVADGNTVSDFDKEEQKRQFSISTSLVPIEWEKAKINVLDTPGYFDFVGEVEEAVSAADAAVIVVSGKAGVEVGTEKAWELCDKYNLPRMIFVTEMDVDDASFRQVVQDLTDRYGKVIAPHFQPIRENEKLVGYVNVIKNAGRRYTDVGKREECEIPEYCKPNLEIYREKLLEAVAETSEEFMERYFAGEEFSVEEIRSAMRTEVMDGDIVPVAMGSNIQAQGVANLLSDIVRFFPSPDSRKCAGINRKTNEIYEADYDFAKAKSAYVFKTMVDPFIGKYSFVKVCSGVLKGDDTLYNADSEAEAKLGKIYTMSGNKSVEVSELFAGDIGAIAKLANTKTGDTLSVKTTPLMFGKTEYSKPYTYMKYVVKSKGDEDKVSQALQKMMAEDVTLKSVNDSENRQTLIYGIGDQHLEVTASKLASRYKCEITLETPKVAFRETIKKKSDVDTKYKKQSGGHGQYGHVKMRFEPSGDTETPYVFEEEVVGGAVPKNYFPAVEKGLQESVLKGPLAGYPVVGVKAVLYDGSYHPVDSSEMAFKTATIQAFKKGFMEAGPVLLEPIASVKVVVPDDYTGDVMGDLNKRRGRVLGMNPLNNGYQEIVADVPMTGLFGYCTTLRSMTGGRGNYSYEFARYEQAPSDVQEAEIAKRAAEE
ncbi:MAG: elongation factor G [Lachnospiraceae bacterium]|nr:elongation factor G [Lachnospiraceae bacterium]